MFSLPGQSARHFGNFGISTKRDKVVLSEHILKHLLGELHPSRKKDQHSMMQLLERILASRTVA